MAQSDQARLVAKETNPSALGQPSKYKIPVVQEEVRSNAKEDTPSVSIKPMSKDRTADKTTQWHSPLGLYRSLDEVTLSSYVKDFILVNGERAFQYAEAAELVAFFNECVEAKFPGLFS